MQRLTLSSNRRGRPTTHDYDDVVNAYLWEQRPLVALELQAVDDESLHGLGRSAVQLAEVRGQVAASNHEDYLAHGTNRGGFSELALRNVWKCALPVNDASIEEQTNSESLYRPSVCVQEFITFLETF